MAPPGSGVPKGPPLDDDSEGREVGESPAYVRARCGGIPRQGEEGREEMTTSRQLYRHKNPTPCGGVFLLALARSFRLGGRFDREALRFFATAGQEPDNRRQYAP